MPETPPPPPPPPGAGAPAWWRTGLVPPAVAAIVLLLVARFAAQRDARDFPLTVVMVAGECRLLPGNSAPLPGRAVTAGSTILVAPEGLLVLATPGGGTLRSHSGRLKLLGLEPAGKLIVEVEDGLHFLDLTQGGLLELRHGASILLGRDCRLRIEDRDGVAGIEVLEGFVWPLRGDQLGDALPAGQWQPLTGS